MIKFLQGNCLEKITELKDDSIDCVVSSPPYFGLRNYEVDGQFGLEKTYQEYIANTLKVFAAFRPKLKDQATIWWNVGDSYNAGRNGGHAGGKKQNHSKYIQRSGSNVPGLKPKDLLMIPNRVAIALQEAGWYIRSEIIWHKPNPMPESVTDRPTACHEKIWLITKNKKYYYDHEAIKEPTVSGQIKTNIKYGGNKYGDHKDHPTKSGNIYKDTGKRNKRNVWTVTTKPFREAHFATFPPDLIEPCVLAGCPEKVCAECGSPYIPNYKRTDNNKNYIQTKGKDTPNIKKGGVRLDKNGTSPHFNAPTIEFLNLKKNCNCKTDKFKSGIVLDPFGGAGTTGLVAKKNNRNAILIELNPEYIKIAEKRIKTS